MSIMLVRLFTFHSKQDFQVVSILDRVSHLYFYPMGIALKLHLLHRRKLVALCLAAERNFRIPFSPYYCLIWIARKRRYFDHATGVYRHRFPEFYLSLPVTASRAMPNVFQFITTQRASIMIQHSQLPPSSLNRWARAEKERTSSMWPFQLDK